MNNKGKKLIKKKSKENTSEKNKDDDKKKDKGNKDKADSSEGIQQEDSEEQEVEVEKADKVGYMEIRHKEKQWKAVHCVLIKGSFFYYKNILDQEPTGSISLKKVVITEKPEGMENKKYVVIMHETNNSSNNNNTNNNTNNGGNSNGNSNGNNDTSNDFTACLGSQSEFTDWVAALKKNKEGNLEEAQPPHKEKRKKDSVLNRAKKKMAGNAATSPLGKRVVKSIINEETTSLLSAMKRIVKKDSGQKKSDELEKSIIKIAVKAYLLIENKKLTGDDFLVADQPLRDSFELMIKCFNGRGRVQPSVLSNALKRVEITVKKAENVITNLLSPHLTNKNMFRLSQVFGYLGNADFLNKVFSDTSLEGELEKLIDAMEYYTQFHYHL